MNIERRYKPFAAEFRADEDGNTLKGHPATFNDTYDLGFFEERIAPGAFDNVLDNDVRALFNHDPNHPLGRTTAGTLRLSVDKRGLFSEIDMPDSATVLREAISRGDVTQMSFGFTVKKDTWEVLDEDTGKELRTIEEIGQLFDVSPVTFPANPNTDVALREVQAGEHGPQQVYEARQAETFMSGVVSSASTAFVTLDDTTTWATTEIREIDGHTTENTPPKKEEEKRDEDDVELMKMRLELAERA